MLCSKSRLVADHTVGVADLMKPLEAFLEKTKDRNLWKQIQPPHGTSWKTSTPSTWLCQLDTLFLEYIRIAPNTVISGKKHKNAICRIDETNRVNFTKKSRSDFYDLVDDAIRMGLSHLRQVKQCPARREVAYRKCDTSQQETLDKLLTYIQLGKDDISPMQDDSQNSTCTATSSRKAVASIAPEATTTVAAPEVPSGSSSATRTNAMAECENIFDSIITKRGNEVDGVEIQMTKPNKVIKKTLSDPSGTESTTSPQKGTPFMLELDEADKKAIEEASKATPIARDGKSQLQRLNAIRGPKKKGKGKGKGGNNKESGQMKRPACKAKKPSKETQSSSGPSEPKCGNKLAKTEEPKSKPKKRPAAAEPSQLSQPLRVRGKQADRNVPPEEPEKPLFMTVTKDNHPAEPTRKVLRNRCTSRAYHVTMEKLKREGEKNEDEIKAAARAVHKEAGAEFDQRWPLEPKGKGKGASSFTKEEIEAAEDVD